MIDAKDGGLDTLSGHELFFYQGIEAFEIFSGAHIDEGRLREELAKSRINTGLSRG